MDIIIPINDILSQVLSSFDFAYMLIINVITYFVIKFIDAINKDKTVKTWTKRIILIIVSIFTFILYLTNGYENNLVLINSTIVAPVVWSWILKPICNKFGIDYKKIDNILN